MDNKHLILEYDDFCINSEVELYETLFKNINNDKMLQQKCKILIEDKDKMRELEIIMIVIKNNFIDESRKDHKGIAYHLINILLNSLNNYQMWEKLVRIIGINRNKDVKKALDDIVGINCVYQVSI